MADRAFGVREINIVGSAGTPTISSPDNINLNGNNVAISTDLQVGRNVSVVGVITANAFYGDGSNLTGVSGGGGSIAGIDTLGTSVFNIVDPERIYGNEGIFAGVVTFSNNVNFFAGNLALVSGSGNSIIREQGSGILYIQSDEVRLTGSGGIPVLASFLQGGGSTLYYGNINRFETTSAGVVVNGICTATSFVGDGSGLTNLPGGGGSTAGIDTTTTSFFNTIHATGTIDIGTTNSGVAVTHLTIDSVDIVGTIRNQIKSGAGNTNAVLDIETKEFLVTDPYAGKGALISADSSGTKLFKDDSLKLQTIGAGVTVTGTMYATSFSGDGSGLTGVPITGNTGSFVRVDTQEIVVSGLSTFQGNVYLGDNDVLNIGDTNDLQIWHSGSASIIRDAGTEELQVQSNGTAIRFSDTSGNKSALFNTNADANLYYADALRLQTLGAGVTVFGTLDTQGLNISGVTTTSSDIHLNQDNATLRIGGNGAGDIRIYHTGTESVYYDNYGITRHAGGKWEWTNIANNQQAAEIDVSNGVKLNYSGTRRFMTTNDGVHVAGIMTATSVSIGASNAEPNLTITSDGTDTFIKELNSTGELTISTNQLKIENPSFETLARFNENADVKLYYDNAEKFATTGSGVNVSGIVTATSFSGEGGVTRWTLGANGSSDYTFTGIGFTQTTNDPDLHLVRGQTYEFLNNSGGSHPFEIRTSAGGQAYNHGVTNNGASSGIIKFQVPYDAPTSLVYICTAHSSMVGNIYIDDNTVGPTTQNFTGIVTATSFQGNSTTGDGSDRGFTTKYYITADGSTSYRFAGPGVANTTANPTLYLHRGFTYIFENSTGSAHPFELRVTSGGAAWTPGNFLSGSINGTQVLTVPFDAQASIVYQCTLHSGMVGTINFVS